MGVGFLACGRGASVCSWRGSAILARDTTLGVGCRGRRGSGLWSGAWRGWHVGAARGLLSGLERCAVEEGEGRAWERERSNGGWRLGDREQGRRPARVRCIGPLVGRLGLVSFFFFLFFNKGHIKVYIYIF
jgi:hypothetical protein